MKKLLFLILISTFSLTAFARPVKRITFPKGATKVTVSGYLNGYKDSQTYVIRLRKGQKMTIDANRYVSLYITDPNGEDASDMDASCHSHQVVENTEAGDYKIEAVECRKADPWKGNFKLTVKAEKTLIPIPSDEEVDQLVKTTTQAFTDAIETEDFTSFWEAASASFKRTHKVKDFNQTFQAIINRKDQTVPILRSTKELKPVYSSVFKPLSKRKYDDLRVSGSYLTEPIKTYFDFGYTRESDTWKLDLIRTRINSHQDEN